jgi:hypothetical protein
MKNFNRKDNYIMGIDPIPENNKPSNSYHGRSLEYCYLPEQDLIDLGCIPPLTRWQKIKDFFTNLYSL